MIVGAVENFVEADGFKIAVRSGGNPEGDQQQASELTKATHGKARKGRARRSQATAGRAGLVAT